MNRTIVFAVRKQKKMKMREFAKILGISIPTLSGYETGRRNPTLKIAYRILDFAKLEGMNLTLEDLYPRVPK